MLSWFCLRNVTSYSYQRGHRLTMSLIYVKAFQVRHGYSQIGATWTHLHNWWSGNCLLFQNTWGQPRFLVGSCFVDRCLIFCTFSLVIILSVPRFTDSDYPFDIFKLLLWSNMTICKVLIIVIGCICKQ